MSGSARIDGCLLLVSDPEANAGTRKNKKQEQAGLQKKKYLVSIKRAITQRNEKRDYGAGPVKSAGRHCLAKCALFSLTRLIDALQLRRAISIQAGGNKIT
jgi:hypothetical protein